MDSGSLSSLAKRLGYDEEKLIQIAHSSRLYFKPFHIITIKEDGTKKTRHIDNPSKKFPLRALQKKLTHAY